MPLGIPRLTSQGARSNIQLACSSEITGVKRMQGHVLLENCRGKLLYFDSPQELSSEAIISTELFAGPVLNPAVISPVLPLTEMQAASTPGHFCVGGKGQEGTAGSGGGAAAPAPGSTDTPGAAPAPQRWAGRVRSAPQAIRANSAHTSQFMKGSQGQIPCVTIHAAPPLGIP